MDTKSLLEKIKSKFIIQLIFSYINDQNILYKLINYSKQYQEKFKINAFYYKEKCVLSKINFEEYLESKKQKEFEKTLSKYKFDYEDIKKIIIKYFKNRSMNKTFFIELTSPILEIISQEEYFKSNFLILFQKEDIADENNKINKNSIKIIKHLKYYPLYFNYVDPQNLISFIKHNKNIFNKIEKFGYKDNYVFINKEEFFEKFFSLNINGNNLIYFKLDDDIRYETKIKITNLKYFSKINNFKSLEYLSLSNIIFSTISTIFKFNFPNLKELILKNIENIEFEENSLINLTTLKLYGTIINNKNNSLIFLWYFLG